MPGITISAGYGLGGSVVAPRLAQRLGLTLLDRAISSTVAEQLHVSVHEAQGGATERTLVDRFLGALAPLSGGVFGAGTDAAPVGVFPADDDAVGFRDAAETIIRAALAAGVVVLGRAGAAALVREPDVLRVRLFGPDERRIEQATVVDGVDRPTAERRLPEVDRARAQYVRRLYDVDVDDPALYHLQLDSTVLPFDACVDVVATAYAALLAR